MVILMAACAVFALIYWPMVMHEPSFWRSLLKTLSVAGLALVALVSDAPLPLFGALALCSIGDFFLSRGRDKAFMTGVGAFAMGHLGYVLLFLNTVGSAPATLFQPPRLWGALALIGLGLMMVRMLVPRAGDLRVPVLLYIPTILGMGLAALTLPPEGALILVLPAALSFIASDTLLATEKFLLSESQPTGRVATYAVWPLYWVAQFGFVCAYV